MLCPAATTAAFLHDQEGERWERMVDGEIAGVSALLAGFSGKRPMYVFSNTNAAHYALWGPAHRGLLAHDDSNGSIDRDA